MLSVLVCFDSDPELTFSHHTGTTLLRLEPSTAVLNSNLLESQCYSCFRSLTQAEQLHSSDSSAPRTVMRCSACKVPRYCSEACQRRDWSAGPHQVECKALQRFAAARRKAAEEAEREEREDPEEAANARIAMGGGGGGAKGKGRADRALEEPGTDIRCLARLLWRKGQLQGSQWDSVLAQQSHSPDLSPQQQQEVGQLAMALAFYLGCAKEPEGGDSNTPSPADLRSYGFAHASELLDFVCAFSSNAFTAAAPDLSPLGVAVIPTAALLNHSCLPNTVHDFPFGCSASLPTAVPEGKRQCSHTIAIKDIKPGEELLTSYLDLSEPYHRREQMLRSKYFFSCACTVCKRCRKADGQLRKAIAAAAVAAPATTIETKGLWMDPRDAVWCPKRCGGWVSLPFQSSEQAAGEVSIRCQSCGTAQAYDCAEIARLRERAVELWQRAETAMSRHEDAAIDSMVRPALATLRARFPPISFPLFAILRTLEAALIRVSSSASADDATALQQLEKATTASLLTTAAMQTGGGIIYPPGHPARAVAFSTLGRLCQAGISELNKAASADLTSYFGDWPQIPTLPAMAPARLAMAETALKLGLEDSAIGFGDGGKSSGVHNYAASSLRDVQAELAMMYRAAKT